MAESIQGEQLAATEAQPIPPRYWWLKRLSLAAGVFVLLLAGVRLWWGWEAERRFQAKIAEYRAAGQPVLPEDYTTHPVADEDNAALCLKQAVPLMNQPLEVADLIWSLRAGIADMDAGRRLLKTSQAGLQLVRAARSKSSADWGYNFASLSAVAYLPNMSSQRMLIKATLVSALFQHGLGEDAEAVETLRDGLAIGRRVGEVGPMLIPYLVREACDALTVSTIEAMAPELQTARDTDRSADDRHRAGRQQIDALIRELLDEQELRDNWQRVMFGECAYQISIVQGLAWGSLAGMSPLGGAASVVAQLPHFMVAPLWKQDALRMLDFMSAYARAGTATDFATANRLLPSTPVPQFGMSGIAKMLSSILLPSIEGTIEHHFRALASRRMAAIALAIRLYELDHGRRPARLADLVPEYLPAVPRDPFDPADGEIRYRPAAPTPLLYSVYLNAVDDGGAFDDGSGSVAQQPADWPFFLNGDRPRRSPIPLSAAGSRPAAPSQPTSAEAGSDKGEVESGQRRGQ